MDIKKVFDDKIEVSILIKCLQYIDLLKVKKTQIL